MIYLQVSQSGKRFVEVLVAVEPKARRNAALQDIPFTSIRMIGNNRCLEPGGDTVRTELLHGRRAGAGEEKLRLEKGRRQSLVIFGLLTLISIHMSWRSSQIGVCSNLYTLFFRWWRWAFLPPLFPFSDVALELSSS